MAYNPLSGAAIQYVTSAGNVASGYYLKFYIANTTTPLSMATDATGGTLLVKCKLSDKGYPISNPADNSTVFIPHINASYRFVLYVNEADADANTTANADVNIPDIAAMVGAETIGAGATQLPDNLEVAAMVHGGQFMTYGGTADVVTLTSVNTVALTALQTGDLFRARFTTTNTGAATINVDGIGALTAKTPTGAALPAGFFRTDVDTTMVYDGTDLIVSREVEKGASFTRFENGAAMANIATLVVANIASVSGSVFRSGIINWSFPITFISVPIVSANLDGTSLYWAGELASTTGADITYFTYSSSAGPFNGRAEASGYWY